jgi:peptidyl-prolyl cis-trans isomerase A (cyclophilin A)
MKRLLLVSSLLVSSAALADGPLMKAALAGTELWATLSTSKGDVVVHLFPKDAPKTVANFVGLATGEKEFTDPRSGKPARRPFYNGLVFHRVIPDFMIQGGDPLGTGTGGPGYKFEDEFQSPRGFDKPGLLAMANAGPNTNGSQFFITTATPTYLNGRHTIFGEVLAGYDVVLAIGNAERDGRDRPLKDAVIRKVTVSTRAPAVKAARPAKKVKP